MVFQIKSPELWDIFQMTQNTLGLWQRCPFGVTHLIAWRHCAGYPWLSTAAHSHHWLASGEGCQSRHWPSQWHWRSHSAAVASPLRKVSEEQRENNQDVYLPHISHCCPIESHVTLKPLTSVVLKSIFLPCTQQGDCAQTIHHCSHGQPEEQWNIFITRLATMLVFEKKTSFPPFSTCPLAPDWWYQQLHSLRFSGGAPLPAVVTFKKRSECKRAKEHNIIKPFLFLHHPPTHVCTCLMSTV